MGCHAAAGTAAVVIADITAQAALETVQMIETCLMRNIPRPFRKGLSEDDQVEIAGRMLALIEEVVDTRLRELL